VGEIISESLGLSWVALKDPRHRHERDAAQAGLNEAAGRELKRLWGLRAPQACPISGQVEGYEDRLTCSGVGAAGSVCSNSGIVRATAIEAWLSVHRSAVGHSGDGDIGHGHCARLGS
jgi:hypothetical protein